MHPFLGPASWCLSSLSAAVAVQEERHAHELLEEEDRPAYVPRAFDAMRKVPAYEGFIKERFERCLDLYLCPRALKKRAFVKDPQTLLPKLPKPQELQPFPTTLLLRFLGHTGPVCFDANSFEPGTQLCCRTQK